VRTVIKNKVYDTATAQEITRHEHNDVTETLYRKKTGEYFAHFYNATADDTYKAGWHGKDKIAPFDFEEAKAWGLLRLDSDRYRELFEGQVGSDDIVGITVRISAESLARLRKVQSETGETIAKILDRLVASI
jgi:hypothetical protein